MSTLDDLRAYSPGYAPRTPLFYQLLDYLIAKFGSVDGAIAALSGGSPPGFATALDLRWYAVDTGAVNALVIAPQQDATGAALVAGQYYDVKAAVTNTGAATLDVGSTDGAIAIKSPDGSDPAAGALVAGAVYRLIYTGAYWQIAAGTGGGGAGTITLAGDLSGSGSGTITATIGANKVTVDKLEDAPSGRILGNNTGATADPIWMNASIVRALLNVENAATNNAPKLGTAANVNTSSITLSTNDYGKVVVMDSASATTVTIPTNATVAFADQTQIPVIQLGAGLVSVLGDSGVTVRGNLNSPGQNMMMGLYRYAADDWIVIGGVA